MCALEVCEECWGVCRFEVGVNVRSVEMCMRDLSRDIHTRVDTFTEVSVDNDWRSHQKLEGRWTKMQGDRT